MKQSTTEFTNPGHAVATNNLYELLFCDNIDLYRSVGESADYPWSSLLADPFDQAQLELVAKDETLESRQRLLAFHLLNEKDLPIVEKELLGVIIEIALPDGLDVLASYSDGTARYINHSEKVLIWDTQTVETNELTTQLFEVSGILVSRIGKWEGERRPAPTEGMARLTFLVSDGLYFGEAPFEALYNDAMGGPVIKSATELMAYLVQYVD